MNNIKKHVVIYLLFFTVCIVAVLMNGIIYRLENRDRDKITKMTGGKGRGKDKDGKRADHRHELKTMAKRKKGMTE